MNKTPSTREQLMVFAAFVLALFFLFPSISAMFSTNKNASTSSPVASSSPPSASTSFAIPHIGDVTKLHGDNGKSLVSASREAMEKGVQCALANDAVGEKELLDSQQQFFVPNETSVLILEYAGYGGVKFRFATGERKGDIGFCDRAELERN